MNEKTLPNPVTLPTYIPLPEATARYGLSEAALRRAVETGIIRAVRLLGEGIAVADEDVAIVAAQQEAGKEGDELVSISEAARRLNIPSGTISRWVAYGWLPCVATGARRAKLVSWQRAQALARLKRERGKRGSRLVPRGKEVSVLLQDISLPTEI